MSIEIAVHGGGFVGLTAAIHYSNAGKTVMVYDPDKGVVDGINSGNPKAGEFLGYLGGTYDREHLRATTSFEIVRNAPVHVVCVPTEKDGRPWMDLIKSVVNRIVDEAILRLQETTIIVESTLTPGTLASILEDRQEPMVGKRIALAHAPRRDWFSDPEKNLATLKRVVGGVTSECTKRAVDVISQITPRELILETDYKTAELTKPLENAFLHVPVMLACEIARAYPDHDVAKAVELACTHWRLMKVHLNAGTGGRCIPLSSIYLAEGVAGRYDSGGTHLLNAAVQGENGIRDAVARAISKRIPKNGKVLVLGIAYRPGFKDAGNSPGLAVAHELWKLEHRVYVDDPMWGREDLEKLARLPVFDSDCSLVDSFDAVLLATPHDKYMKNEAWRQSLKKGQFVLDAQGAWKEHREEFEKRSVQYKRVGDSGWM